MRLEFAPSEQRVYDASMNIQSQAQNATTLPLSGLGQGLNVEINSVALDCPASTVTARVTVSDGDNQPVPFLEAFHFALQIGGADAESFSLEAIEALEPASVGLALDWSRSLESYRNSLAQSSEIFIDDELRSTDTAGVFRFAFDVDGNAQDFVPADAAGKELLKDALYLPYDGAPSPTVLWDSANKVLVEAAAEANPKRAIVLLTDGFDNQSTLTVEDLIESAVAANVTFFVVGFGEVNPEPLEKLATETGGLYFYTPDTQDLTDIYQSIATVATNQYEIVLDLADPAANQPITVTVVDDFQNQGSDTRGIGTCP